MNRYRLLMMGSVLSLSLAACMHASAPTAPATPANITDAVADSNRPAADQLKDANRKPIDTLEFADVKPGEKIAELLPGDGYFTRMFSKAVGPKGHVYTIVPPAAGGRDFAAKPRALAADPNYGNVSVLELSLTKFATPDPVDLYFTAQNYHDLHNFPGLDIAAFNKAVFDSLKPGGLYVILDHSAEAGSGVRDTATLHRIDPEAVKKEVSAAGFVFVASSSVLTNPADPRTANVRDPSVRGKTDQFMLKFRKPAK
jgi:predicted methyltransferase